MNNKILMINEKARKKLWEIKIKHNLKSHNEAVEFLIKLYYSKNNNSDFENIKKDIEYLKEEHKRFSKYVLKRFDNL